MEDKADLRITEESRERSTIRSLYESFKVAEQQPPDPNEVIFIGKLDPNSLEHQRLQEKVDSDKLEKGAIKRQDLLDSGFVFLNRVGGGEKPIFKTPQFESRILLTQEELDGIKNAQKTDLSDQDLDKVRFDMFSFLLASLCDYPFGSLAHIQNSIPLDPHGFGWSVGNSTDWALVDRYWNQQIKSQNLRGADIWKAREPFLLEDCKDLLVFAPPTRNFLSRFVRGKEIRVLEQRTARIRGVPSPFLDSGFHFGTNPDVTILDPRARRMNIVSLHLLSRGLSEIGESNKSYDQHYITLDEYLKDVYPTDPQQREKNYQEEEKLFQSPTSQDILTEIERRMIQKAKDWQARETEKAKTQGALGKLRQVLATLKK